MENKGVSENYQYCVTMPSITKAPVIYIFDEDRDEKN